jgi:hypothetical protein
VLASNVVAALGMFTVEGDRSWFAAVPGAPVLDAVTGLLLVLGVVAWLGRLAARRDPVDAFVLAAGLLMLLPSALALAFPVENPHTTRTSGAIPAVFLLAAWPLALIRRRASVVLGRVLASGVTVLLLAAAASGNYRRYFVEYDRVYRAGALNPGVVARAVRDVVGPGAPLDGVWLQGWPYWHDYRAVGIEAGDLAFRNAFIDLTSLEKWLDGPPDVLARRPLVFIVHPRDADALARLEQSFPGGRAQHHPGSTQRRSFVLFVVRE